MRCTSACRRAGGKAEHKANTRSQCLAKLASVSISDFFMCVFRFVLFVSYGSFAPFGLLPLRLHAVVPGYYGVPVLHEIAQRGGYHHRVNRPVELAVPSALEPPEEQHHLRHLQVAVIQGYDVRQCVCLFFCDFLLAAAELANVGQ